MTTSTLPVQNPKLAGWKATFQQAARRALPGVRDFFVHVLAQARILKKIYPGVMHFLIFWGVTIQVIGTAINLMQMQLFIPFVELTFPRGNGYLAYELVMDLAGVAIFLGVGMALFRRMVLRPKTLQSRWDDWFALVLLILIPLAGFSLEGLRLQTVSPEWSRWSPVGQFFSGMFQGIPVPDAVSLHPVLFWTHAVLGLVLVASIPFTKLRHLIMTPLNVILRNRRKDGVLDFIENIEETEQLGVGEIANFQPRQLLSFEACLNCGRCEEDCPVAVSGGDYTPRLMVQTLRQVKDGTLVKPNGYTGRTLVGDIFSEHFPWACTTCGACIKRCPAFVNPVDEIVDMRRYQVLTTGKMPRPVGDVLRNLERQGNPWGMPAQDRLNWADGLDVREIAPGEQTDVLLFLGCAFAYDDRNKKVVRSFVQLLKKAGVDFAVLGFDEMCCGETARRMGHEYLFQEFARQNIETLSKIKFNKIVTQCPHCFNTLKNEYPQLGGEYEVLHYSQFLAELKEALPSPEPVHNGLPGEPGGQSSKVAYHDPCYLGRYNQVLDAPRALLAGFNGNRVELSRSGADSFCCGGGGGGMWMETDPDKRINNRRLEEALDAGANLVATACPYCLLMFDDAIRSKGLGEKIQVMDLSEIIVSRIPAEGG